MDLERPTTPATSPVNGRWYDKKLVCVPSLDCHRKGEGRESPTHDRIEPDLIRNGEGRKAKESLWKGWWTTSMDGMAFGPRCLAFACCAWKVVPTVGSDSSGWNFGRQPSRRDGMMVVRCVQPFCTRRHGVGRKGCHC